MRVIYLKPPSSRQTPNMICQHLERSESWFISTFLPGQQPQICQHRIDMTARSFPERFTATQELSRDGSAITPAKLFVSAYFLWPKGFSSILPWLLLGCIEFGRIAVYALFFHQCPRQLLFCPCPHFLSLTRFQERCVHIPDRKWSILLSNYLSNWFLFPSTIVVPNVNSWRFLGEWSGVFLPKSYSSTWSSEGRVEGEIVHLRCR